MTWLYHDCTLWNPTKKMPSQQLMFEPIRIHEDREQSLRLFAKGSLDCFCHLTVSGITDWSLYPNFICLGTATSPSCFPFLLANCSSAVFSEEQIPLAARSGGGEARDLHRPVSPGMEARVWWGCPNMWVWVSLKPWALLSTWKMLITFSPFGLPASCSPTFP